jgi:DNA-directed RNA polymerase subunit RPC12/RpoP
MLVYACASCGGQIVGNQTSGATSCPYCGNPVVVAGQFAGGLRPDLVVPFQQTKQAAIDTLQRHYQRKKLLPKSFKTANYLNEVKGMYVPTWLFDFDVAASADYSAQREIRTSIKDVAGQAKTNVETQHYRLERAATVTFDAIPVDGSSRMPDDIMESVAPFDVTKSTQFNTSYLTGFLADRYDVDAEASKPRAVQRMTTTTESLLLGTTSSYSSVRAESKNIQIRRARVLYSLLPVWILSTTWNKQRYTFAMNGQTGKFVGNLPTDRGLFWKWFFGLFFVTALIGCGASLAYVSSLTPTAEQGLPIWPWIVTAILALLVALIPTLVWQGQLKTVHLQAEAKDNVRKGSFQVTHTRDHYLRSTNKIT